MNIKRGLMAAGFEYWHELDGMWAFLVPGSRDGIMLRWLSDGSMSVMVGVDRFKCARTESRVLGVTRRMTVMAALIEVWRLGWRGPDAFMVLMAMRAVE